MENTTTNHITIVIDGKTIGRHQGWTPPVLANYPGHLSLRFLYVEETQTIVTKGSIAPQPDNSI